MIEGLNCSSRLHFAQLLHISSASQWRPSFERLIVRVYVVRVAQM
jgi:hypothetical protein